MIFKKKMKKKNTSLTWLYVDVKCNRSDKNTSNIYNHEKYAVETNVLQLYMYMQNLAINKKPISPSPTY